MANATLSVVAGSVTPAQGLQDNTQKIQKFYGNLAISARTDVYTPGGLALDSVLQAALLPNTNQKPLRVKIQSTAGSGYIYQRIAATGKMMILQVPVNGSLTTAAPLNELPSGPGFTLSGVWADTIEFEAEYLRNA